tara:strand:+ start:50 stop:226 length:177 start_codon:yes stop_codon:yes gene_type:complete
MTEKTTGQKNNPTRCQSSTCCKATASLEQSVAGDLKKEDKNLQELLDDNNQDITDSSQ